MDVLAPFIKDYSVQRNTNIRHDAEMSKVRFWQEAALKAMHAYAVTHPPNFNGQADLVRYTRRAAKFAFEMAEQMHKNHGPSVAPDL